MRRPPRVKPLAVNYVAVTNDLQSAGFRLQLSQSDDLENLVHAITIGLGIVYTSGYELSKQSEQNHAFSEW